MGYYRDMVDGLDEMGRTVDAARAREKLSAVLEMSARYEASLPVLAEAAETYRATGDLDGRARVSARIGLVHASMGRPREGVERLQPLLEPLEASGPSRGLAALLHALGAIYFAGDQYRRGHAVFATAGSFG